MATASCVVGFPHPKLRSVVHKISHAMIDISRWPGMTTAAVGDMKLKFALLLLCFANAAATNDLITQRCPPSDNFTSGGTFHLHLNAVLTSLIANSVPTGFNTTVSGEPPDIVYGLALCRGDLTSDDCRTCVSNSAAQLAKLCPTTKDAIIWYEYCELRYSYANFFGVVDTGPRVDWRWMNRNVTNVTLFNNRLGVLFDNLTSKATSDPSALKFATGAVRLTDLQKIYGLVQCTRDLTLEDCKSCLDDAVGYIPKCCSGTEGAQVLKGSCNVRFDTNIFYFPNRPAPHPSPAPNPPDTSASPSGSPASSPIPTEDSNPSRRNPYIIPISISIPLSFLVTVAAYIVWYWKIRKPHPQTDQIETPTVESLLFDFHSIETATDNFSDANKLGQGGYGPVYKGRFPNGQEIAVKRLSANSGQGATEFKSEVLLAAKLQHRNLVRILGCCLERQEKMLIYQYMPNSSLDKFLFDPTKRELLDWRKSFNIIIGIARGLLYLHEESQLKVIHRDLKPSNILLDERMTPKIADFGMARIFGLDQTESNTNRIAGTYGYMSPEYALYGIISEKSDVFSFGIIVLEILTGRKITFNQSYTQSYTTEEDLLTHSWKLWREKRALELVNYKLATSSERNEALRCIHVGLLCVQEDPAARPLMSSIVLMLGNASMTCPLPTTPPPLVQQRNDAFSNIMSSDPF